MHVFANLVLKLKFIRYPDLVPDALKDTKDHSTCGPPSPLLKKWYAMGMQDNKQYQSMRDKYPFLKLNLKIGGFVYVLVKIAENLLNPHFFPLRISILRVLIQYTQNLNRKVR